MRLRLNRVGAFHLRSYEIYTLRSLIPWLGTELSLKRRESRRKGDGRARASAKSDAGGLIQC